MPVRKIVKNRRCAIGVWGPRSGQSLIESCLVLIMVCIVFFGVFQVSQLFAAQEVLQYAAARGARASVVGFNRFMVRKTVRVGAIPNAGQLINPATPGGPSAQQAVEAARIPLYLGGENEGQLRSILDYEDWDTVSAPRSSDMGNGTLQMSIRQNVTLMRYPLHRLYYAGDSIEMQGESTLDNHAPLYLDDWGW